MGGAVDVERGQQIMGMAGQPAAEAQDFQYRYSIDSDDYNLYPDTPDIEEEENDEELMEVFAERVRKLQEELAAQIKHRRVIYSGYDLTNCEKVRAELFSLRDKVCFTLDRNGILFNAMSRKRLNSFDAEISRVEIAYNPIMQMIVVRRANETENSLQWVTENKDNSLAMKRCSCRGFANVLYDNMGWNLDYKYRVVGSIVPIDDEPVLVFSLENPIRIVPANRDDEKNEQNAASRKNARRQTKVLLEAGFAPDDFSLPTVPEIDLGSDTLNEKAKNAARSRAIYYDNYTSAEGVIHVEDLGDKRFDPECIRQILQKGRAPEEKGEAT